MCGISGWFDMVGLLQPDRLLSKAMNDAIAHRGPDGEGFHFEPGLALGHRRLAIIDLSTGEQPMFTEGSRIAIVFNGEIFNYRQLRRQLERQGHPFRTNSDTEVILRAWVAWGHDCVDHIEGQFAFALWDRSEQTLFLARDRLGEKPLYYAVLPDKTFVFASELKALTVRPDFPRRIDPRAVEDFFAYGYVTDPRTIYAGVKKLGAGCALSLQRGQEPKLRTYWQPKPISDAPCDAATVAEELRARLAASVNAQLVADVPVGTFLSGGVDSSAITALMAKSLPQGLSAFTIGFKEAAFDERSHAEAVASRYGVTQHVEVVSPDDMETVARLPGIYDEPFGDSSAMPTYRLCKLARRHVTVALSGDGGDELFAGYRRYPFHAREEALRGVFPGLMRRLVFGTLGEVYPQLDWAPRMFRARQTFRELAATTAEGYFHNVSVTSDELRSALFAPELKRALKGYRAADVIAQHMKNAPFDDPVAMAQYVDLKTWLPGDILTKVDRASMANSLEVRVPMLDASFVEWALSLPRDFKLRGGEGKFVLKRALEPLLPHKVLYRPKQGFSVPLARWFRGEFGEAFSLRLKRGTALDEFLDLPFAARMLDAHRKGWSDNSRTLWLIWMFDGFLQRHLTPTPELV
ncbi:asparagine synthase (glutamine-hydrolysing) [Rhizomicrobium palustre]|uniref:asparagine synthase (glutamine-hydrolyzing) n=1 Tax=Rhizomicrobium palustre TaxID=189966 RepID=A0A846MUE6_9PROT|nr:XrtA/PEP-CTERM system amidotransferase [Rhizomicrobium palustre]NIK86700.1 asparagine synthase (glutamine-hydrolysing) [Rhizomicrobium palustre]